MIGVFDSGLGGLSVLAAIARSLPRADLCYLADTAQVPYGNKTDAFIQGRVLSIGRYLVDRGCRLLVVACNTATAAAVNELRQEHSGIAIVGVEPGVKPAAAASLSRKIAVLATESTIRSERLARLIRNHAETVTVYMEPCPGWATRVETLALGDPLFTAEIASRVTPLLDQGVDQLVLGCTHYSFLAPVLKEVAGDRAQLVDVADAIARQVVRLSGTSSLGVGSLTLLATARPERLQAALPRLGLNWLVHKSGEPAKLAHIHSDRMPSV